MENWCLWWIGDKVAKFQEATTLFDAAQEIQSIRDFKLDFLCLCSGIENDTRAKNKENKGGYEKENKNKKREKEKENKNQGEGKKRKKTRIEGKGSNQSQERNQDHQQELQEVSTPLGKMMSSNFCPHLIFKFGDLIEFSVLKD